MNRDYQWLCRALHCTSQIEKYITMTGKLSIVRRLLVCMHFRLWAAYCAVVPCTSVWKCVPFIALWKQSAQHPCIFRSQSSCRGRQSKLLSCLVLQPSSCEASTVGHFFYFVAEEAHAQHKWTSVNSGAPISVKYDSYCFLCALFSALSPVV